MNTDPLCPQQHTHPKHNPNLCIFCEEFAAVRAEEWEAANLRWQAAMDEYGENCAEIEREACIEAVQALYSTPSLDRDPTPLDFLIYEEVIPAIRARGEKS